ncbi:MAG TPA: hypothetical protein VFW24_07290 [Acidimicrobiales bacterium]|nr:hypothetical protein [Acidimicrobiales bacterium]
MRQPEKTFQATDVARRSREVLDSARAGGTLIRDKDGVVLLLALAEDVARQDELTVIAADFLRLQRALATEAPDVGAYGGFGWVSVFGRDDQRRFGFELEAPLLLALSGGPIQALRDLIDDWKATAEVWTDEALREELSVALEEPLYDSSL